MTRAMRSFASISIMFAFAVFPAAAAESDADSQAAAPEPIEPIVRVVDLNVGEARKVELHDGSTAKVKLLGMEERRDAVIGAVREVRLTLKLNGEKVKLTCAPYALPVPRAGVQIDCPVTIHYVQTAVTDDAWALKKDARLRLWPAGSPWVRPDTFTYPLRQRWLASATWYSNEPIRARERDGKIYYHDGMDLGGAEGMDEVVAATDGLIVQVGEDELNEEQHPPARPRYDVIYIRDPRGWYYRYSHLDSIDPGVKVGQRIEQGRKIGVLGKEGASGGWSHLHFEIVARQPSGAFGTRESYAFLWQAYQRQHDPPVLAVARPRHLVEVGEPVTLDATRSWAEDGIESYRWLLSDGTLVRAPTATRRYEQPGHYSEILRVTDVEGRADYDFAIVKVVDPDAERDPTRLHASFHPTRGIEPGEKVTFKVRAFGTTKGRETWRFGDGSGPTTTRSNQDPAQHADVGYATITHRYDEPGHYIVTVRRTIGRSTATAHLHVPVGMGD